MGPLLQCVKERMVKEGNEAERCAHAAEVVGQQEHMA